MVVPFRCVLCLAEQMRDFTTHRFRDLIVSLKESGYSFVTFDQYIRGPNPTRLVILRHDVDLRPGRAAATAAIEAELGIKGTYYFRIVPGSWDPDIVVSIGRLGHEIGYHYEDLTLAGGDTGLALELFRRHLDMIRSVWPVSTVCMHGSPLSEWDNRDLWRIRSYRDFGVLGEPYFDVDFTQVGYLTDTGRRWDGKSVSVRDKLESAARGRHRSTQDVIRSVEEGTLPSQLMITVHPQRWTNDPIDWMWEVIVQRAKNEVKRAMIVMKGRR